MKKLIFGFVASFLLFASCTSLKQDLKTYNQGINIIPQPVSVVQNEGSFILKKNTGFVAETAESKNIAEFFAKKINQSTGFNLGLTDGKTNKNVILLELLEAKEGVNPEAYILEVTPTIVKVKATTPQGLFFGMQSFMQLLPAEIESSSPISGMKWAAPAVTIQDEPRFGYRGIMLDPCRHFIPVEEIKKQLDVLALFKINTFHWHLTEDQGWRIEIKKYPKLTEIGSSRTEYDGSEYKHFYTQEEVKEIVKYAQERFITVIPEIELPGHALAAITSYPYLACNEDKNYNVRTIWGIEPDVYCAGKESTFEFLEDVIKEVVTLFPGKYFHIGGDECPKVNWKKCPLCQQRKRKEGLKDEHELQSYFIQRVEKILEKYGKKMIGWDEILEGGLAPSATVMSWRGESGGIKAANMDHDVIMTPGSGGMYLDHYQGSSKVEPVAIGGYAPLKHTYSYNPFPKNLPEEKWHYIKGAQCNIWTEYMYTTDILEYRIYPRILALSELTWTPLESKDFEDFSRRLENASVRLDMHDINYHIPQPEQVGGSMNHVAFTDDVQIAFETTRPIRMIYSTDGREPDNINDFATYESPLRFTETTTLKIRSVMEGGRMSPTRTINVVKEELSPAVTPEKTMPGLELSVAYGKFKNVTELKEHKEWENKVIKTIGELVIDHSNESLRDLKPYSSIAKGYINIPEDGVYVFSTNNQMLLIDDRVIIDNGDEVKRFSRKDTSIALQAGLHKIEVIFIGKVEGGWPTYWDKGHVLYKNMKEEKLIQIPETLLCH